MNKAFDGLMKASAEKRYKSFLSTVADLGTVWLLSSKDGFATYDDKDYIYLLIWPKKEFCIEFAVQDEIPVDIEVHDFIERCKNLNNQTQFMVFPTSENAYVVSPEQLQLDITEQLELIE